MNRKKHSLKQEFALIFFGLTAGMILLIFMAYTLFLERYYIHEKQAALERAYLRLNDAAVAGSFSTSDFEAQLSSIFNRDNIGLVIMDEESRTVKVYTADSDAILYRLWDNLLGGTQMLPESEEEIREMPYSDDRSDRYYIVRTLSCPYRQNMQMVLDRKSGTQYLEMWGILDNSSFYLMRSALESIQENSRTAGRFILYVGAAAILIGGALSLLLARKITKPISQLTEISKRMKALDFSAKYTGRDHNEIAELGENINDLSGTLEQTISELKSANAKLLQDIEQRDKADEMQREFISSVTHELKTPIALIQGYAEGLQEGIAEDEQSRAFYTSVIIDESARMNDLVQKLLTLMRLEFGRQEFHMTRFDIMELIRDEISSADILLKEAGIHVRFRQLRQGSGEESAADDGSFLTASADEEDLQSVFVWSDKERIEEVLRNYLSNAIHYCDGEKIIEIKIETSPGRTRVGIFNTGTPIAEADLPHIWDRFYKADKARTRVSGSSGIGLSIVKATMESLHQAYGVINYDNGVAFWFEIPS